MLTTGGGLVFVTDDARRFRAFDAETGDIPLGTDPQLKCGRIPGYLHGRRCAIHRHPRWRWRELPKAHPGDPATVWWKHALRLQTAMTRPGPRNKAAVPRVDRATQRQARSTEYRCSGSVRPLSSSSPTDRASRWGGSSIAS